MRSFTTRVLHTIEKGMYVISHLPSRYSAFGYVYDKDFEPYIIKNLFFEAHETFVLEPARHYSYLEDCNEEETKELKKIVIKKELKENV